MKDERKKIIATFSIASFLNDLGSDMIYPIWPLFVTVMLNANMTVLGIIDGLGDAIVSISQAISGYLSDKLKKRKLFIWLGYLFSSMSRIGYAISTSWLHLIPFKILDRFGKIRGSPRDAFIADVSTKYNRGSNFGLLRAMDNLGAVFGIILCILLFNILGYKKLFLLAAIPSLIAVILILIFIKEKPSKIRINKGFSLKGLNNNLKLFLLLSAIFAIGSFSYSFLLVFANRFGFKTTFIPVLYLIFTLIASIFSLPFGRLADRIGRKNVLAIAYIFWGLICFSFIFLQNYFSIFFAFVLYGLHKGALDPAQRTFVSELSPKQYRASVLGGFQMIVGLCALPASFIAGVLWDKFGLIFPFVFSLILTIISLILLIVVKEK
ncbi:MAG: MFS transporter [Fervidobacterium sp.]